MTRSIFDTVLGQEKPITKQPSIFDSITIGRKDLPVEDPTALGRYGFGESKHDWGLLPNEMDRLPEIRASHQSSLEQFGAFLNQAAIGEIVGGTIEGAGYLFDLGGIFNMIRGQEEEFGNWFSDLGKGLRSWTEEVTPIHVDPRQAKFAPGHWSWWMQNGKSVASTLSLLIPAAGTVRAVGLAGKALNIGTKMLPATRWALTGVSQATLSRHMENMMEASGLREEVYNTAIQKGMSEVDASKKAAIAAQSVYNKNWAMILQDIPQYLLLNRGFSKAMGAGSEQSIGAARAMGKSIAPVIGKKSAALAWDMSTEGMEEAYQYVVQEESRHLADVLYGEDDQSTFSERLGKYTRDGEFWTSAFFGAIGAGVFQTVGKQVNQWISGQGNTQVEDIKSWGARFSQSAEAIKTAKVLGQESSIKAAQNLFKANTMISSASAQNLNNLRDFVKSMENPSAEDFERFGISKEDFSELSIDPNEFLKDIDTFEGIWNTNAKKYNHVADRISYEQFVLEKNNQHRLELQDKRDNLKGDIVNFDKLSFEGKEIFELQQEVETQKKVVDFQKKRIAKSKDKKETERIQKAIEATEKSMEFSQKEITRLKEDRAPEDAENDAALNLDSAKLAEFIDATKTLIWSEEAIRANQEEIKKLEQLEKDISEGKKPTTKPTPGPKPKEEEDPSYDERDYEIESGDIVEYLDTKGNPVYTAIVDFQDDGGDYVISQVNENNEVLGEAILAPVTSLRLNKKYAQREIETEPLSDEEISESVQIEDYDRVMSDQNEGLASVATALAYVDGERVRDENGKIVDKFDPRNKELNDHITSAANDLSNARVEYEIDLTSAEAKERWSNIEHPHYIKGIPDGLRMKILAGKPLRPEEVSTVVAATKDNYKNAVDRIPIKASLVDGDKKFSGGMFVHDTDYSNIVIPERIKEGGPTAVTKYIKEQKTATREFRRAILEQLLAGNEIHSVNLDKTKGHYNNTKNRSNIITTLGGELKDKKLIVIRNNRIGYTALEDFVRDLRGNPGTIITTTNKTANGKQAYVRVLPTKITKEHADILWDALKTMYNSGKGGARATFPDARVSGLNVLEVIRMLVLFGDRNTNVDNPVNNLGEHLRSKALYVHSGKDLFFGKDGKVNLKESNKEVDAANKKAFTDWVMANKNYNVMLNHKDLKIQLNEKLGRSFKIGSWEYDSSENLTYAQVLMSKPVDGTGKYVVETNLEEWKDTGSVMTRPVLILGNGIKSLVTVPKDKPKVNPKKTSKQNAAVDKAKRSNVLKTAGDLIDLPTGSIVYYEFDDTVDGNTPIGEKLKSTLFEIEFNEETNSRELKIYQLSKFRGKPGMPLDLKERKETLQEIDALLLDIFKKYNFLNETKLLIEIPKDTKAVETISETAEKMPVGAIPSPSKPLSPEVQPETSTETTVPVEGSIEAKRDDIERRRQEALTYNEDSININDISKSQPGFTFKKDTFGNKSNYKGWASSGTTLTRINAADLQEYSIKVNELYDAELAALEQPTTTAGVFTQTYPWGTPKGDPLTTVTGDTTINTGATWEDTTTILGLFEKTGQINYTPLEVDKELKWYKSRLNTLPVELTERLIELGNDREAFGRLLSDMILLYRGAIEGTLYHESLHNVTLLLLDPAERAKLYKAARAHYFMPNASDLEVDERMAEDFRRYKLSGQKPKNRTLIQWFTDLWNLIKSYFTGTSKMTSYDIERFFDDIERGKFKYAKATEENIKRVSRIKPTMAVTYDTLSFESPAQFNKFINRLTEVLINVSGVDSLNKVNQINMGNLFNKIDNNDPANPGIIQNLSSVVVNTNQAIEENKIPEDKLQAAIEAKNLAEIALSMYKLVVSKEYKKDFIEEIAARLKYFNIRRKMPDDYEESKDLNVETGNEQYDVASYEVDSKDNVLASVKFLIATLHKSNKIDKQIGTPEYVDFNAMWSRLKADLYDIDSIEEGIDILKSKPDFYPYQMLVSKLEADKSGELKQSFRVAMSGHKHNYLTFLFNKKKDKETGGTKYTFSTSSADIDKTAKRVRLSWNLKFFSSAFINKDGVKINEELVTTTLSDYNKLVNDITTKMAKDNELDTIHFDRTIELLNRLGISIDDATLYEYMDSMSLTATDDENLEKVVVNKLRFIFDKLDKLSKVEKPDLRAVFENEQVVRHISNAYVKANPDLMDDSILGPEGNIFYIYAQNSYVTDKLRAFRKDVNTVQDLANKLWHKRSYFLDQMLASDAVRANIKIHTFSSLVQENTGDKGRNYLKLNNIEDYLFKMYAFESGRIPFSTMADKKTYYLLEGLRMFSRDNDIFDVTQDGDYVYKQEVIDIIYGYVLDEKERVDTALEFRKQYKELSELVKTDPTKENKERLHALQKEAVEGYHYILRGNIKDYTKGNAYTFHEFPTFDNISENDDFEALAKERINNLLTSRIKEEIEYLISIGIIGRDTSGGVLYNIKLDNDLLDKEKELTQSGPRALYNVIARTTVNSMISNVEIGKLFVGDPAFYKANKEGSVFEDRIKRLSVLTSTGDLLADTVPEKDLNFNEYTVATLNTQKFETVRTELNGWHITAYKSQLEKRYKSLGIQKTPEEILSEATHLAKIKLDGYDKMDISDGQAWISPSMYRQIAIRLGEWSSQKQEAFNLLQLTRELTQEEEQITLGVTFQPLKLVYFDLIGEGDLAIPTYDKMSVATVFRSMAQGNQIEDMLDRMEATGKYAKSLPVHMFKMDSVVKVGNRMKNDFFDENIANVNDLTNIVTYKQKFTSLRRQLITDAHDVERTKTGTQFIKLVLANLDLTNAIYALDNKKVSGKDLAQVAFKSLKDLSTKGREQLEEDFGIKDGKLDIKKFVETLRNSAIQSRSTRNLIEALKMDGEHQMFLELDSFSDKNWVHSMIISSINKHTIDLKLPGNQFIQFSNFGMRKPKVNFTLEQEANATDSRITWLKEQTNDLKFYSKDANGNTVAMEAIVSINLFKHIIPNYDNITFKEKLAYLKDNPEVLGYRIPTQGTSSISVLKIAGIYPETIGDTITLPNEFTTLTGSDFDIDKLYVVRYNYEFNRGKLKKIKFIDGDTNNDSVLDALYWNKYGRTIKSYEGLTKLLENNPELIYEDLSPEQVVALNELYSNIDSETVEVDILYVLTEGRFDTKRYERLKEHISTLPTKEQFREQNRGKDIYTLNSKKAVENRLLDVYFSVLKNAETFTNLTSKLDYLNTRLKNKADQFRKWDQKDMSKVDLGVYTPKYQQTIKWYYTSGKNGIGPFALNNVHHVLAQLAGLKMRFNSGGILNEDSDGNVDLSQRYDKNEHIEILDWLSAMITSFVDIAKDPYIIDLNINEYTYNVAALLLRSGLGESTFDFLSQPILKELAFEEILGNQDKYKIVKENYIESEGAERKVGPFAFIKAKWEAKLGEEYKPTGELTNVISGNLVKDIQVKDEKSKDYIRRQLDVLAAFQELRNLGGKLNTLIQASQIDTKKYGNSYIALKMFMNNVRRARMMDDTFIGLDNILPFDTNTNKAINTPDANFLGKYIENSIIFAQDIFKDVTVYATPVFDDLFDKIYRSINPKAKSKSDSERLARTVADELFATIMGGFFTEEIGLTQAHLKTILDITPKRIAEIQNDTEGKYKYLKGNPLMDYLMIIPTQDETLPFGYFIEVPPKAIKNSEDRDNIINGFRQLLKDKDKYVRDLGRLLFYYSFYTSGFRNRIYSFFNVLPNELMKEFLVPAQDGKAERFVSYNDYVRQTRINMQDNFLAPAYANYFDEFFRNNVDNKDIVPDIFNRNYSVYTTVNGKKYEDEVVIVIDDKSGLFIGETENKQPLYKPFVKVDNGLTTKLYRFIGTTKEESDPIYVLDTVKGYDHKGIVIKEYNFTKSLIPENNVVAPSIENIRIQFPTANLLSISDTSIARYADEFKEGDEFEDVIPPDNVEEQIAYTGLKRIISGIQSGVDAIGVRVAKALGIDTGGFAPPGFEQEGKVFASDFAREHGVIEVTQAQRDEFAKLFPNDVKYEKWLVRTWLNAMNADATLYVHMAGDDAGLGATFRYANKYKKPLILFTPVSSIKSRYGKYKGVYVVNNADDAYRLLRRFNVQTLNIAGNRESKLNEDTKGNKSAEIKQQNIAQIENFLRGVFTGIAEEVDTQLRQATVTTEQAIDSVETIESNPTATLSTPDKSLKIYTDGSDIKGTGQIGSGVWFEYNGKEYSKSTVSDVNEFKTRFNITESVSNPTMEIVALVDALEEFKNTKEHLVIYSDYEGVQKWVNGQWKAKKPYIQSFVERAKTLIANIEENGGSVKLEWVKGHSGNKGNDRVDTVAKARREYNDISKLLSDTYAVTAKTIVKEQATQLDLFGSTRPEITQEILDGINKIFGATYTVEDLNNLSDKEFNNLYTCYIL